MRRISALLLPWLLFAEASIEERLAKLEQERGFISVDTTQIKVGGRLQFDITEGWPEGSFTPQGIPLNREGEEGQLGVELRDSRLWLKTQTPSELGLIRTVAEIYFYGEKGSEINSNAHGLALRYFYVSVAGWTAGQANSLFSTYVAPETLVKPINLTYARQPLIGYSIEMLPGVFGDLSLEQPETLLDDPSGNRIQPSDDRFPDLLIRLRWFGSHGKLAVTGMARYITQDQALLSNGTRLSNSDGVWGYGLNASLQWHLYGLDNFYLGVQHGNAIGRYFTLKACSDGVVDAAGKIHLNAMSGVHAALQHWWSSKLQSNLVYTHTEIDHHTTLLESDVINHAADAWQVNLIFDIVKNGRIGLEYGDGLRELESGDTSRMQLLRLQIRYDF